MNLDYMAFIADILSPGVLVATLVSMLFIVRMVFLDGRD